jgi:hypothetical protein
MDMYKTMKPFHLHGTPLYYGKEYVIWYMFQKALEVSPYN